MPSFDQIRRLGQGAGLTTLIQGAKSVLGLASIVALGRLITPEDYGRFAIATTFVGIAALIKDSGVFAASLRVNDDSAFEKSTLHWISVLLGGISASVIVAASPAIAWAYGDPTLARVIAYLSITLLFGGFTVQYQAHLLQRQVYKKISLIDLSTTLGSTALGITAAAMGAGIYALVLIAVSQSFLVYVLSRLTATWRPSFTLRTGNLLKLARFGGQVSAVKVMYTATSSLDTLLLGKVSGMSELGAYGRAQSLALLPMSFIVNPLQNIFLEWFGSSRTSRNSKRWTLFGTLFAFSFVSSAFAGAICIESNAIVALLMGPNWEPSSDILVLLVGCAVFVPINAIGITLLTASGHTTVLIKWSILHNALIAISVVAGIGWGAKGLALAHTLTSLFLALPLLLNALASAWQIPKKPLYLVVLWPIICTGIAVGIMIFLRDRLHLGDPYAAAHSVVTVGATVVLLTAFTATLATPRRFLMSFLSSSLSFARSRFSRA